MKTNAARGLIALALVSAGLCGNPAAAAPASKDVATPSEEKTVEEVEKSELEFAQKLVQWNREGWAVTWTSGRLLQPDGTILRKVKLRKASSPDALLPVFVEFQAVEFLENEPSDLQERMKEWEREGWRVLSMASSMSLVKGAKVRRVELQRSPSSGFRVDPQRTHKTETFLVGTPSKVSDRAAHWNHEGWAVVFVTKRKSVADGIWSQTAHLSKPRK